MFDIDEMDSEIRIIKLKILALLVSGIGLGVALGTVAQNIKDKTNVEVVSEISDQYTLVYADNRFMCIKSYNVENDSKTDEKMITFYDVDGTVIRSKADEVIVIGEYSTIEEVNNVIELFNNYSKDESASKVNKL